MVGVASKRLEVELVVGVEEELDEVVERVVEVVEDEVVVEEEVEVEEDLEVLETVLVEELPEVVEALVVTLVDASPF